MSEENKEINQKENLENKNIENDRSKSKDSYRGFQNKFNKNRTERKKTEFTILEMKRVSRTMAGGRRMKSSVLLVVNIGKGVIGIGHAKAAEVRDAIHKAIKQAEKYPVIVPLYDNRTFVHASKGKFGATEIKILPRKKESGLRALGVARKLAKSAGIKDGSIKMLTKASSKKNICNAFVNACNRMSTLKKVKHEQ